MTSTAAQFTHYLQQQCSDNSLAILEQIQEGIEQVEPVGDECPTSPCY